MATKVQTQLLVSEVARDRADALALVLATPRAEVLRMALDGAGLAGLEETYRAQLVDLGTVAARMGMGHLELARKAKQDGYTWEELKDRQRYPRARRTA
jgi:hypothetical protein